MGGAGTALGVGLGLVFLWGFTKGPILFEITVQPTFVLISSAIGLAVALASAIIPSRRTSRLDPIEVIQGG